MHRYLLSMALVFSAGLALGLGVEAARSTQLASIWQRLSVDRPAFAASGRAEVSSHSVGSTRAMPNSESDYGRPAHPDDLETIIARQLENREIDLALATYRGAAGRLSDEGQLARAGERLSAAIWRAADQARAAGQHEIAARYVEILKSLPPVPLEAVLEAVAPSRATVAPLIASTKSTRAAPDPGRVQIPDQRASSGTMGALAPPATAVAPDAVVFRDRGEQLLRLGDISAARRFFERAIALGDREASTDLGKTFDPLFITEIGARGVSGNVATALRSYRSAAASGNEDAKARMRSLLRAYPAPEKPGAD